jgi:hypothetical protein
MKRGVNLSPSMWLVKMMVGGASGACCDAGGRLS